MQVAEVLSDLTSLRVCGHEEAVALVNVHKTILKPETTQQSVSGDTNRVDSPESQSNSELQRAKDLVQLHNEMKSKQLHGGHDAVGEELQRARFDVNRVLRELEI
ncbi:hypothetical protein AJ80_04547 [Polytolypa hystricis UAMH7299]|uniref:Uncharacterized protein n=1 Tax=Polytolypa hystricis (strain UAMH7299) TaxID=1447883 RepID=A0A2B7YAE0_POLH7|nr:hypothetical protein AJ80_04547 [Polytolypa hystricis UAMH7299]